MNDRFLEDLKSRVDLVEVVRRHAELKKTGKNFMCRSPLRNERTPSFCVSPDKQLWYDFGTGEGGDAISFVEKIENVSFPEAIEILANIAGVEVPKSFGDSSVSREQKKDIFLLHEKAVEFFTDQLQKSKKAKSYLASREISEKITADWQLGYGGDKSDGLTKFLLTSGFSQSQILQSGVAFEREFGAKTMRDRFLGRLIIPICEPRNGEIIAFSGRDLSGKKDMAKYINSPENPVYHKSSTLFGLDRARKDISDRDAVILVEGNFDVISAHEMGLTHTVATCGTSFTENHLRMLKRFTKNIFLAFDPDMAGKKATLRAVEMILRLELFPFIIEIPRGKDLDELARENANELQKLLDTAPPATSFLFEKFAQKNLDESLEGEKKFLDAFFYFLKLVNRPIEIDDFLTKITKKLKRPRGVIEEEFKKFCSRRTSYQKPKVQDSKMPKFSREENFVGFLCAFWSFFRKRIDDQILEIFSNEEPRKFLSKKLHNESISNDEQLKLSGWQLFQENLYNERVPEEVLKQDFKVFANYLQKQRQKHQRLTEAKKVRENIMS